VLLDEVVTKAYSSSDPAKDLRVDSPIQKVVQAAGEVTIPSEAAVSDFLQQHKPPTIAQRQDQRQAQPKDQPEDQSFKQPIPPRRLGRSEVRKVENGEVRRLKTEGRDLISIEKASYPSEVATSSFQFVVPLVGQCAIEVAVKYKVSNLLLFVALQKLARSKAPSNGCGRCPDSSGLPAPTHSVGVTR
jgi:hypothetical protein